MGDWVWVWLGVAVLFGFGELLTPVLFFSLSFAIGAVVAALFAAFSVGAGAQVVVFLVATTALLVVLVPIGRRLARADPVDDAAEGSTRWVGRIGVVIEEIPAGPHDTGLVRVERTQWRAETDADLAIPAGAQVEVLAMRGTRLVVAPLTPTPPATAAG
jgi:membrane protein implicated in regulation of membrane protease activity